VITARNFLRTLLVLLVSTSPASAAVFNNADVGDSNWSTGGNWDGGAAPTSGEQLISIIVAGSSNQDIAAPFMLQTLSLDLNSGHTISGNQLQFDNLGGTPEIVNSTLGSNTPNLDINNDIELLADVTVTATAGAIFFDGAISGPGGLLLQGNQSIFLRGSNTFTGTTTINRTNVLDDVFLQNNGVRISGDLNLMNGELHLQGNDNLASTSNVTISGGRMNVNENQTLPGMTFAGGTLQLSDIFTTLTITGDIDVTGNAAVTGSKTIDLGGGTRTFDVDASRNLNFSAPDIDITNGDLIKAGDGTLIFTQGVSFDGEATITAGEIRATTNSITMNVANEGVLNFNQSFSGTYNGVVSGTGSLRTLAFGGSVTLTAAQTYTGLTDISSGTLAIGDSERIVDTSDLQITSGTFALGAFDETVGVVSMLTGSASITGTGTLTGTAYNLQGGSVSAVLAGSAQLTKSSFNNLTLSGANTFTGGTLIQQGTVFLSGDERLADSGAVTLESGGGLSISGTETIGALSIVSGSLSGNGTLIASSFDVQSGAAQVNLSGAGALTKTGAGTFTLQNANSYTGGTFVNEGTLQFSGSERLDDASPVEVNNGDLLLGGTETIGTLTLNGGTIQFGTLDATAYQLRRGMVSSNLIGSGALNKTTADTVTLTGSNSYTGGTTINAGTLVASASSIPGDVANEGILRFQSGGGTYAGEISGSGAVEINSFVIYTGPNSYTGGTTISSVLSADTSSLPGDVTFTAGTLQFNQTTDGTFAGDISGLGFVHLIGSGELTLSGNNSYSEGTLVEAGASLAIGSNTAVGTGVVYLLDASTIRAEGGPRTLINELNFNPGTITFSGSEDLTFNEGTQQTLTNHTLVSTNSATTSILAPIIATETATLHAAGGNFVLGDPTNFLGFRSQGSLLIDNGATMTLLSAGFADVSPLTTLGGGTLAAPNGVSFAASENLVGHGAVNAKIAAQIGSVISATTGDFAVGDATSVSGFFSDGELFTNENEVTINDANEAVLGSLTTLGDGTDGGTLTAGTAMVGDLTPHFLLEEGKNLIGRGTINGNFKNQGHVIGDGTMLSERIVFEEDWIVSGKGTFTRTLVKGTFAPGESPGVTNGEDQAFSGNVQIELGGLDPGNGSDNHDQINDTAMILLLDEPTLEVLPFDSFLPELGDQFVVMTWQTGLNGTFGELVIDTFFTSQGISFQPIYNNVGGAGNLTLVAVQFIPEPSSLVLAMSMLLGVGLRRRCLPE
jgi:autotransporter-associated beta strand protein